MKEKKKALVQAMEVAEAARTEAAEWRRKYDVAAEVGKSSSEKLKEERVELAQLKRALEEAEDAEAQQEEMVEECKATILEMEDEIEALRAQMEEEQKKADEIIAELEVKVAELGGTSQVQSKETEELIAKNKVRKPRVVVSRNDVMRTCSIVSIAFLTCCFALHRF